MPQPTFASILSEIGYGQDVAEPFRDVRLPFELKPHQVTGLHYGLYYDRFGLFFEPRTGKSIVLQLLALFASRNGAKTIQLMPPGLFRQFRADYDLIHGHGLRIDTLSQSKVSREKRVRAWENGLSSIPDVLLMSAPIFLKHWDSLRRMGYTNLHFDEAHQGLQDEKNKISTTIQKFIKGPQTRLVLSTGTPIPSRIENAFGTVRLLRPGAYLSRRSFEELHVSKRTIQVRTDQPGETRSVHVVCGYRNIDALHHHLSKQAVFAAQRDVLKVDAPNIQIISYDLSKPHAALYRKVLNEQMLEMPDGALLDARKTQKLRQVAMQIVSCPEVYDEKIHNNSLVDTLKPALDVHDLERNKVVIFANYNQTVERLAFIFAQHAPQTVYGPNGPARNAQAVEAFRNDQKCRLLIANPIAGGVGFKLGDVCTRVIFAEPTSSPGHFTQALSRVLLMGQTEPVVCDILRASGTLWTSVIESMLGRIGPLNELTGSRESLFDALFGDVPQPQPQQEAA